MSQINVCLDCTTNRRATLILGFNEDQLVSSDTDTAISLANATAQLQIGNITFSTTDDTITVGDAGIYLIVAFMSWQWVLEGGQRQLSVNTSNNSGPIAVDQRNAVIETDQETHVTVATFNQLSSGDTISFDVFQNTGIDITLFKTTNRNLISITKLL